MWELANVPETIFEHPEPPAILVCEAHQIKILSCEELWGCNQHKWCFNQQKWEMIISNPRSLVVNSC